MHGMTRLTALLAGTLIAVTARSESLELTLSVTAVAAQPGGQMLFALFDSEQTHLKTPVAQATAPIADDGTAHHVFESLASGEYSVSAVQDLDEDGEMDTNFIGMPREPVAISNNPKGFMGPPSWQDSRVQLTESRSITIRLTGHD